jgi:DNA-binding GntR family transcriptional regulator
MPLVNRHARSARPLVGRPLASLNVRPYHTMAQRVANYIRQQIIRGDMKPGARLREARIAREQQMSRAPVREAIGQLVQEGWATKRANQSARIIAPTAARLREAGTLRGVLEGYGATLAMERLDTDGIDALTGLVSRMRDAVNAGDLSHAFELDFAFHDAIMQASGHRLLYDMWRRMGAQIRFLISGSGIIDRDFRKTVELHRRILTAFQKGDTSRVKTLMGIDPQEVEELVARVVMEAGVPERVTTNRDDGSPSTRKGTTHQAVAHSMRRKQS